ncbi:hypothetical protein MHYP_G00200530 [Metynnis hypsauchen]
MHVDSGQPLLWRVGGADACARGGAIRPSSFELWRPVSLVLRIVEGLGWARWKGESMGTSLGIKLGQDRSKSLGAVAGQSFNRRLRELCLFLGEGKVWKAGTFKFEDHGDAAFYSGKGQDTWFVFKRGITKLSGSEVISPGSQEGAVPRVLELITPVHGELGGRCCSKRADPAGSNDTRPMRIRGSVTEK